MVELIAPRSVPGPRSVWLAGVTIATAASVLALGALPFADMDSVPLRLLAVACLAPYLLVLKRLVARAWTKALGLAMVSSIGVLVVLFLALPVVLPGEAPRWLGPSLLSFLLAQLLLFSTSLASYRSLTPAKREGLAWRFPLPAFYCFLVALFFQANKHDFHRQQRSNGVEAIQTLRMLHAALALYEKECGGFPDTLEVLASPPPEVAPDCNRHDSVRRAATVGHDHDLEPVLAPGTRMGYRFVYRPATVDSETTAPRSYRGYEVNADPVARGETGFASFWMSQDGRIHENFRAPAGPSDPVRE
jgi:hypothetical protein